MHSKKKKTTRQTKWAHFRGKCISAGKGAHVRCEHDDPFQSKRTGHKIPDCVVVEEVCVEQGLHQTSEVDQHVVAVPDLVIRAPHPVQDVKRPISSQKEHVVPCEEGRRGGKKDKPSALQPQHL